MTDGNTYTLQIYPVKEHDQGVYRCEIDGTKLGATLELVVQGGCLINGLQMCLCKHLGEIDGFMARLCLPLLVCCTRSLIILGPLAMAD